MGKAESSGRLFNHTLKFSYWTAEGYLETTCTVAACCTLSHATAEGANHLSKR